MDHSNEFLAVVNDAKSRVREVSVAETHARMKGGAGAPTEILIPI